jgi:hypothetical protein
MPPPDMLIVALRELVETLALVAVTVREALFEPLVVEILSHAAL